MATELDSFGRSPLHLASATGHTDIVRELLQVNVGVCGFGDEDGITPLHLAAMKGRVEVIRELVRCRPESTRRTLGFSGETVLHLCVKHNHLEALKLLMEDPALDLNEDEFVNHRDNRGNTILQLAAALKQVKTIEYLVQIEAAKGQANMKNTDGFTALDILEHNPITDWKSTEVRGLLLQAAAGGGGGVNNSIRPVGISDLKPSAALIEETTPAAASELEPQTGCCSCKSVKKRAGGIWDKYFKIDEKWIEVARGNLIMAATITATVAFQAGLNPPGSVWQSEEDFKNSNSNTAGIGAGASIIASLGPEAFMQFMNYNTISFISSVCVILMMISGFPLNNKFSILLLTLAMCTTLTFMVLTYLQSLQMIIPYNEALFVAAISMYQHTFFTGIALFALVFVIHLTRVSVWTVRKGPQSCLVKQFIRCWKTVAGRAVSVLHKPARTDENEPHHHQTA